MDQDTKTPPTASPHRKPPEKQKHSSNSLMNLLSRRSTKVEPSPPSVLGTSGATVVTDHSINHHSATTTSAHSSPTATSLNQFRQGHLRRHSSTQNISTIHHDDSASPLRNPNKRPGGIGKKGKAASSSNRFSHQFTLCCSVHDERMCTPPVSVRYNSLAQVELRPTKPKLDDTTNNDEAKENGIVANGHGPVHSSKSFTVVTVHNHEDQQATSNVTLAPQPIDPLANVNAKSASAITLENSVERTTDKPVVFNEYQSSIAMSACRSRLRQRLLPPAGNLVRSLDLPSSPVVSSEQHFSSPNICTTGSSGSSPSRDKPTPLAAAVSNQSRSLSYDVLTGVRRPASADSLAKQSLIAAQLLNLIPAERARERYIIII